MTASQRLLKGQKKIKPAYLLTKEEILTERDTMEANWNDSMYDRMGELGRISIVRYKMPLSKLA